MEREKCPFMSHSDEFLHYHQLQKAFRALFAEVYRFLVFRLESYFVIIKESLVLNLR
jgi:hypothetical protein